jgi:hypothetical protein
MANNDLPIWDGDPKNLPGVGDPFIYKGLKYLKFVFDGKDVIYSVAKLDVDLAMSIRAFPGHTGSHILDMIFKAGIADSNAIADAIDAEDTQKVSGWANQLQEEFNSSTNVEALCKKYGFTDDEFLELATRELENALINFLLP